MQRLSLIIPISILLTCGFVLYNMLVLDKGSNTVVVYWGSNAMFGLLFVQNAVLGWKHRKSELNVWLIYTAVCVMFLGVLVLRVLFPITLQG
jgi:hypothetical protein